MCLTVAVLATETPPPFDLHAALEATAGGDTLLVPPGTYPGPLDLSGRAITVMSTAGPEATVIDGRRKGSVLTLSPGGDREIRIEGFTLTRGSGKYRYRLWTHYYEGGAAFVEHGKAIFKNCHFSENKVGWWDEDDAVEGRGGAIFIKGYQPAGSIVVEGCEFDGNTAAWGGAIYSASRECVSIDNSVFKNCLAEGSWAGESTLGGGGGAVSASPDSLTITNSTFIGCAADKTRFNMWSKGGALSLLQFIYAGFVIENNIFIRCTAAEGGAVYISSNSEPARITGNIFLDNTASGYASYMMYYDQGGLGGALYVPRGDALVERNTFGGNTCFDSLVEPGFAAACAMGGGSFVDNIVMNSKNGGGVAYYAEALADHNLYWNNTGGDIVGFEPPSEHDLFVEPLLDPRRTPLPSSPARDSGSGRETSGIPVCDGRGDRGAREYCGPADVEVGRPFSPPPWDRRADQWE